MSQKRIQQIEKKIDRIKRALLEIGPMRPGSLTRQYKDPQHHAGAYLQISYTRRMKSRTEYVRREWVKDLLQTDRESQAVQKSGRAVDRPEYRALTTDHAGCRAQGYLKRWNSVLSSKQVLKV